MNFGSIRYSALSQNETEEDNVALIEAEQGMQFQYGMPEGSFDSAFTYATYNDLDRMGYEAPKRFGRSELIRGSHFTYTNSFNTEEKEDTPMNSIELILYGISILLSVITLPFSLIFMLKFMNTSERLVVLRLGRAQKTRGPGATIVLPCIDSTHKINTSITAFNVPPLQIITVDRGLIELGATVFLKIRDPISAVCGVQDRNNATRTLANTMLHRYACKKRICEVTNSQDRRMMGAKLKDELESFTAQFGVEITDIQLSDVKVIKEGENMGMAALSAVAKSETGQAIWKVMEPMVTDFVKESQSQQDLAELDAPGPSGSQEPSAYTYQEENLVDIGPAIDIDHLITVINLSIDEHLAKSIGKVFQINAAGVDPVYIDLKHGSGHCAKGTAPYPDVVFDTTQMVFFQILKKTVSPITAYMNGSLKIKGAVQDALLLRHVAERVSEVI